jgi:hypothetical protein
MPASSTAAAASDYSVSAGTTPRMTDTPCCRLCDGATRFAFAGTVLGKYSVQYLLCTVCGSLQTEPPYWLAEAYSTGNLAREDTGPVMRCQQHLAVMVAAARVLRLPRHASIVDFGGGNGLLCRMLRDVGFDARVCDRYAANTVAQGFDDRGETPDIMCAFEVAEHFADPSAGMAEILGRGAAICLVSTCTYRGQGQDWWYLSPRSGQHVFFYSPEGMRILAQRHNYHYERIDTFHVFLPRKLPRWQDMLLSRALSPRWQPWIRAGVALRLSDRFSNADRLAALAALE